MSSDSPSGQRGRREARERAIELSYEADARELTVEGLLATQVMRPASFVCELLFAVEQNSEQIDGLISAKATGWTIERMARIDLLVMRLATAEMLAMDTPTGVVLSEAVDLASRYSTDDSSRFVNGLMSAIAAEVR